MLLDPHSREFASACYDNPQQVADSFLDLVNNATLDWLEDDEATQRMFRLLPLLTSQPWNLLCITITSTDNVIAIIRLMRFAQNHNYPILTCEYVTKTAQNIIPKSMRRVSPMQKTNSKLSITFGL